MAVGQQKPPNLNATLMQLAQTRDEQQQALLASGDIIGWLIGALMPNESQPPDLQEFFANVQVVLGDLSTQMSRMNRVGNLLAEMVRTLMALNHDYEILYINTNHKLTELERLYREKARQEVINQIALKQNLSIKAVDTFISGLTGEEERVSRFVVNEAKKTVMEVADDVGFYAYEEPYDDDESEYEDE